MNWLVFVALAAISWGLYGPTLAIGTRELGHSSMRALMCVGVAYFVLAIIIPAIWLRTVGEHGGFTPKGITGAGACGVAGALGAIFVIFAFTSFRQSGTVGSPLVIMSLVFAGAPVINALTSWAISPPPAGTRINPLFYVGIILAAVSAGLVLYYKPTAPPPAPHASVQPAGATAAGTFAGDAGHAPRAHS